MTSCAYMTGLCVRTPLRYDELFIGRFGLGFTHGTAGICMRARFWVLGSEFDSRGRKHGFPLRPRGRGEAACRGLRGAGAKRCPVTIC